MIPEREQPGEITRILRRGKGVPTEDRLWELIFDRLRSIAKTRLAAEAEGQTLSPTGLVNELWLRLRTTQMPDTATSKDFLYLARHVMKNILIDQATRRAALRRGGGQRATALDSLEEQVPGPTADPTLTLDLDRAFERLRQSSRGIAADVFLKHWAGETFAAIGEAYGKSDTWARRECDYAKGKLIEGLLSGSERRGNSSEAPTAI